MRTFCRDVLHNSKENAEIQIYKSSQLGMIDYECLIDNFWFLFSATALVPWHLKQSETRKPKSCKCLQERDIIIPTLESLSTTGSRRIDTKQICLIRQGVPGEIGTSWQCDWCLRDSTNRLARLHDAVFPACSVSLHLFGLLGADSFSWSRGARVDIDTNQPNGLLFISCKLCRVVSKMETLLWKA